jgi:uncharacterized protein
VKLVDVNVFVNAINGDSDEHLAARRWLLDAYGSGDAVGLSSIVVTGVVRIVTRRGILPAPLALEDALAWMGRFITHPTSRVVEPGPRHWALFSRLLVGAGTAGNLATDAHLAALAIEHNATLVSFDHDFERFAGLRFERLQA